MESRYVLISGTSINDVAVFTIFHIMEAQSAGFVT